MSASSLARRRLFAPLQARPEPALALLAGGLLGCLILARPGLGAAALLLPIAIFFIADPRRFLPVGLVLIAGETVLLKYLPADLAAPLRYTVEGATIALTATTLFRRLLRGELPRRTPLDLPLIGLAAVVAVSALLNDLPLVVVAAGVKNLLRFVFLFYLIQHLDLPGRSVDRLGWVLLAVAGAEAGLCLLQPVLGERLIEFLRPGEVVVGDILLRPEDVVNQTPFSKAFGTMGRYNYLGNYLAFVLSLLLAPVILGLRSRLRFRLIALLGLGLYLTSSRMSILGLALAAAWMLLRGRRRAPLLLLGGFILAAGIEFGSLGVVDLERGESGASARDRFYSIFTPEYRGQSARWYTVTFIIPILIKHSPLFGLGPGTLPGDAATLFPEFDRSRELGISPALIYWLPDVGVGSLIGQFGLLGAGCLGWMLWRLFRLAAKLAGQSPDQRTRGLSLGFAGMVLIMGFCNLPGFALTYRVPSFTFWLMAGVVARLARQEAELPSGVPEAGR